MHWWLHQLLTLKRVVCCHVATVWLLSCGMCHVRDITSCTYMMYAQRHHLVHSQWLDPRFNYPSWRLQPWSFDC